MTVYEYIYIPFKAVKSPEDLMHRLMEAGADGFQPVDLHAFDQNAYWFQRAINTATKKVDYESYQNQTFVRMLDRQTQKELTRQREG